MGQYRKQFNYRDTGTDSASYTYTTYPDYPEQGRGGIQTTGTSTTIDATTAAQVPFAQLNVGDIMYIRPGGGSAESITKVVTKTSPIQIVVADNYDIATPIASWGWFHKISGQAATSGGVPLNKSQKTLFVIQVTTLGSTSLDFRLEGRSGSGLDNDIWIPIWTQNVAAADLDANGDYLFSFEIVGPYTVVRFGEKANTPGTDVFSAYLICSEKTT